MEWDKIFSSPVTYLTATVSALFTVVKILWGKYQKKDAELTKVRAEMAKVQDARVNDLMEILKRDD